MAVAAGVFLAIEKFRSSSTMPFLPSMPTDAGPPTVFALHPDLYRHWAEMSEVLMNGASPFDKGERELILAYAAGSAGCDFVATAHAEVAYAWGVPRGLVEDLLADPSQADPKWRPLLAYVAVLAADPGGTTQAHVDAVLTAGWGEDAVHGAAAVTARAAFMQRLVQGFGFATPSREVAARHAARRVERGYVNLYRSFRS